MEKNISLEGGGATLDVGTGRFAMSTGTVNGSMGVLTFEGGQRRVAEASFVLLFGLSIGGSWTLMI